jgi:hypothetical protein
MKRWLVLGLVVCACGGSSNNNNNPGGGGSGAGSITGSVGGQPLSVKDAIFYIDNNAVLVLVADQPNLCSLMGGTTLPGTTTALLISLANFVPPTTVSPHVTGDYTFFDLGGGSLPGATGRYWYGEFDVVNTSCAATATHFGTGGTVTVTQVGSMSTHLKVNLTGVQFGTDSLNGNIEASYCTALGNSTCGGALIARPSGFAAQ